MNLQKKIFVYLLSVDTI